MRTSDQTRPETLLAAVNTFFTDMVILPPAVLAQEERPFQPPLLAHSRHEKTLLSSVWSGMRGQGQNLYVPGVIFGKNLPCKPRWKGQGYCG